MNDEHLNQHLDDIPARMQLLDLGQGQADAGHRYEEFEETYEPSLDTGDSYRT